MTNEKNKTKISTERENCEVKIKKIKNKIGKVKNKNETSQLPLWASVVKAMSPPHGLRPSILFETMHSVTNINEGIINDKTAKKKATCGF